MCVYFCARNINLHGVGKNLGAPLFGGWSGFAVKKVLVLKGFTYIFM